MTDTEYKNCPYCDETIRRKAIKCRYCQSDLADETSPEVYDFSQDSTDEEPRVTVEAKCPKCNAFVPENVTICSNCRAQLAWKDGRPRFSSGYAMQQTGCAISSFGCLLPLLLIIILMMVGLIGGC